MASLSVAVEEPRRQRFDIRMDPAVIAPARGSKGADAARRMAVDMAEELEALGRHNPRKGFEGFEADMSLGSLRRQLAALGAMPGIDKAAAHLVDRLSDMHLQRLVVLCRHRPCFLAARTAALKSSISRSGLAKL